MNKKLAKLKYLPNNFKIIEEGDYVKVSNESDHDQLVYLRIFDKAGWRGRSPESEQDPQS